MAGAYRCPVCGIDFPSGTPGAPDVTDAFDDRARYAEPPREDIVDAEFEPEEPDVYDPDDALDFSPGAERGRIFEGGSGSGEGRADLNVRPRETYEGGNGGSATLSVRPAREATAVSIPVPEPDYEVYEEDEEPPRRRNWGRALFGTLLSGLVLLALVAGAAWWLNHRGALPGGGSAGETVSIAITDGWVDLPKEGRPLVVEADGPFRLRIAGKVYSLQGDRAVQVPPEVDAAVRIVRGPTTATVRPR